MLILHLSNRQILFMISSSASRYKERRRTIPVDTSMRYISQNMLVSQVALRTASDHIRLSYRFHVKQRVFVHQVYWIWQLSVKLNLVLILALILTRDDTYDGITLSTAIRLTWYIKLLQCFRLNCLHDVVIRGFEGKCVYGHSNLYISANLMDLVMPNSIYLSSRWLRLSSSKQTLLYGTFGAIVFWIGSNSSPKVYDTSC